VINNVIHRKLLEWLEMYICYDVRLWINIPSGQIHGGIKTCFGHEDRHTSSIFGQLYVSDAMHRMDRLMICFGHGERHACGQ
jgi:hypothetical protein